MAVQDHSREVCVQTSLLRVVPAIAVLAVALPVATPAQASPAPFTSCASDAKLQVTSVDIEPQPLVPGKKVTVRVSGTLSEQLTGGAYDADIRYMGVSVQHLSGSVGELITLPAQPGPVIVQRTMKVPNRAPSGSYELSVSATDQNGAPLTCLTVPFHVA